MKRLPGIHAPHLKNTDAKTAEILPVPKLVHIPMSMHIGAPARSVVTVGDIVKVGQLLGEPDGAVSSPVHSSVSGTVKSIDAIDAVTNERGTVIIIESDGLQTPLETLTPPDVNTAEDFIAAVRDSGVVGLGGAGFPTAVKLTVKDIAQVEYFIVNGAECEPYITSDTRTMIDDAELLWDGIRLVKKHLGVTNILIGIENNKPEAIRVLSDYAAKEPIAKVVSLPAMYPQGGEKVLIYNLTGRIVEEGKLPLDAGCIVINCTTLAAVARYIKTGMPLVEKRVTVDGSAVRTPKNVIAPIGTPLSDIFDFCGGLTDDVRKILYGGPMMGVAVLSVSAPVKKSTNAIIALNAKDAALPRETECIRCGRCIGGCPLGLMPAVLRDYFLLGRTDMLEKYKVNLCMECGCCSFNCPAKRSLTQTMKLAKARLRESQAAKNK
ncbi:MAG: electron transport complex subunit RsxC [Oscillospiraceae bacterium]|nr:electron transport complex subunit RsxC [Oscillospiraceae bacterium]